MGYSRYVGRIGGLAVALGVGIAVASPAGVALAKPDDTSTPVSPTADTGVDASAGDKTTSPPSTGAPTEGDKPDDNAVDQEPGSQDVQGEVPEQQSPTSSTDEIKPGVVVSSSGGAKTSSKSDEDGAGAQKTRKPRALSRKKAAAPTTNMAAQTNSSPADDADTATAARSAGPVATAAVAMDMSPMTLAGVQPVQAKAAPSPATFVMSGVIQPVLSTFLGALPGLPTESPLAWIFAAAARRQVGQTQVQTMETASPAFTTMALVADQPPTVNATFDTPVAVTGAVTGQVVGTDPEGKAVTYALTTRPTTGTLVFDSATAKFTYTPTTAQRISAGMTPTTDTIAMTVTVSDGTNSVPSVVNIPVSPAPIAKLAEIGAVNDAHAVATTANRAYVTNKTAGTVTVIDTTNNTVIGTIAVGPTPDGLVVKPDGTKLYVTSLDNNTVTVVDTTTSAVTKTVAVAKPSAIAINSSGSTLYVTNLDAGTVTKISTSTYGKSTVKLPTGSRPTGIAVSPDKTKIYVVSEKATGGGTIAVFGYTSSTVTTIADLTASPTGLAVSPDNKRLYVTSGDGKITVVDTATRAVVATHTVPAPLAGVSVSKDGSTLLVTDTAGRVAAIDAASGSLLRALATRTSTSPMSVSPGTTLSQDGTKLYVTDYDADKVYVVSIVPPNNLPAVSAPTIGAPNATTGAVIGAVKVTDVDKDPLTYTLTGAPTKGTVVVKADGTFTYTPTAAARHAASTAGAGTSLTADSFTVSVSDGRGGVVTPTVTINILPTNKVPTITKSVGTPSSTTGVVTGYVKGTDGDKDAITYTASAPAKGSVVVTSTGTFTYTPTAQARHAAARVGALTADKQDTFTMTVDDGHGGVVPVVVTVTISPANAKPTGPTTTGVFTNLNSGRVTGTVTAADADGDTLTYKATTPAKGTLVMKPDGTYTYTPTATARQAASAANATTATKTDTATVTVTDGYGGTTTYALQFSIAPNGHVNVAPANGSATVGNPNMAIGAVSGTLSADDAERDALSYVVANGPTKGQVKVDANGAFTYVPNVEARWGAKSTPGVDTDQFTVTVNDGYGGSTSFNVNVTIAPPSTAASAIDQRGTTVAMNAQQMLFYSQADTDRTLDLLKADGVDTVRILIPWAGVEASDDVWTWSAIDRMVNSANARDMKVLGILNSTPAWAAAPGTPALSGHPADPQEYAEFVSMVATRYKGKVAAYEVWNEPNGKVFWEPTPDAAQYTELLRAAYPAIKAADPDAIVVAGSVGAVADSASTVESVRFVREMYEAGAAGYFDAFAYHPYFYYRPFTEGGTNPTLPLNQVQGIHDLMVANGDGNKKIWATEYGQPAGIVSEANQAAYIDDFLRAWRDIDYAGPAFIHTFRDYTSSSESNSVTFGVYRQDWSAKPAVGVIETVIDENQAYLAGGGGIEL